MVDSISRDPNAELTLGVASIRLKKDEVVCWHALSGLLVLSLRLDISNAKIA